MYCACTQKYIHLRLCVCARGCTFVCARPILAHLITILASLILPFDSVTDSSSFVKFFCFSFSIRFVCAPPLLPFPSFPIFCLCVLPFVSFESPLGARDYYCAFVSNLNFLLQSFNLSSFGAPVHRSASGQRCFLISLISYSTQKSLYSFKLVSSFLSQNFSRFLFLFVNFLHSFSS